MVYVQTVSFVFTLGETTALLLAESLACSIIIGLEELAGTLARS